MAPVNGKAGNVEKTTTRQLCSWGRMDRTIARRPQEVWEMTNSVPLGRGLAGDAEKKTLNLG